MIVRAFLLFLVMFAGMTSLLWLVFRSNILNREIVAETLKTGTLLIVSVVVSGFLVVAAIFLERSL